MTKSFSRHFNIRQTAHADYTTYLIHPSSFLFFSTSVCHSLGKYLQPYYSILINNQKWKKNKFLKRFSNIVELTWRNESLNKFDRIYKSSWCRLSRQTFENNFTTCGRPNECGYDVMQLDCLDALVTIKVPLLQHREIWDIGMG